MCKKQAVGPPDPVKLATPHSAPIQKTVLRPGEYHRVTPVGGV